MRQERDDDYGADHEKEEGKKGKRSWKVSRERVVNEGAGEREGREGKKMNGVGKRRRLWSRS